MIRASGLLLLGVMTLCVPAAWGLQEKREPHIGYLYPGGGRQGTVVHIFAGGQLLNGVNEVYVSGEGVTAKVVRFMGRTRRLNGMERREVIRQLLEVNPDAVKDLPEARRYRPNPDRKRKEPPKKDEKKDSGKDGKKEDPKKPDSKKEDPKKQDGKKEDPGKQDPKKEDDPKKREFKLPNHPLLNNLDKLSALEVEFLVNEYIKADFRRQPNAQIAETVFIEITIDEDAPAGDRELRLMTRLGLTNPMCFQVGQFPELREKEPANPRAPAMEPATVPVTINGQIKPGDIDRFRFRAEEGQQLVIEAHARHLIPFLADAVPGWFQATLALYDEKGAEVAFVDDYRFHPDPVLFYRIPKTGVYQLEIRDSIYRGREDFVYRIDIGESPFIKSVFPLGGTEGNETVASIEGWNLPGKRMALDTKPGADCVRHAALDLEKRISNRVTYAVDTLPECLEAEPNDTLKDAQPVELPKIVNGRVGKAGDVDVFRFQGKGGDEVVLEVLARRLLSPMDSLVRLTDASGEVVAWNDDLMVMEGYLHTDMGVLTHHSDSYLRAKLPKDGVYYVHVTDSQRHGGEAFGYRVRISPPRPDFSLRMAPSTINIVGGIAMPITVHALRKDGYDGAIRVSLKDAPEGWALQGAMIPAGRDRVRMTLTAPRKPPKGPVTLKMEGRAEVGDRKIVRPVVPSEDMMQAFLWRHLVPCGDLVVTVVGGRMRMALPEVVGKLPVRIPVDGTVEVQIKLPMRAKQQNLTLELTDPPEGVTLKNMTLAGNVMTMVLTADKKTAKVGLRDNLIIEIFMVREIRRRGGKGPAQKRRFSIGVLPAIPIRIVDRSY